MQSFGEPQTTIGSGESKPNGTPVNVVALTTTTASPSTVFPERLISGWQLMEDFPFYSNSSIVRSRVSQRLSSADSQCWNRTQGIVSIKPHSGDKLGGFPNWAERPMPPRCNVPGCSKTMHLLFQLSGGEGVLLNYDFCLDGNGFIFQCGMHTQEMRFVFDIP